MVLLVLAVAARAAETHAQPLRQQVPFPDSATCARADHVLRTGDLALPDSQLAAYRTARGCLQGGQSIAVALDRRRNAPHSMHLSYFYMPEVLDSAMLRTTLNIAADPSASVAARAMSQGMLMTFLGGIGRLSYGALIQTRPGKFCDPGGSSHASTDIWSTLPPDTPQQIKHVVSQLERDTTQPPEVRSAANCVMNEWRIRNDLPIQALVADVRAALSAEHVCGKLFRIKSTLPALVTVQFEAGGSSARKLLGLVPKATGQPYGETLLDVDTAGELRVYFDGDLILTKPNSGATCP